MSLLLEIFGCHGPADYPPSQPQVASLDIYCFIGEAHIHCFLRAGQSAKCVVGINYCDPHTVSTGHVFHLTAEVQWGQVTCPRSCSYHAAKAGMEPRHSGSRVPAPTASFPGPFPAPALPVTVLLVTLLLLVYPAGRGRAGAGTGAAQGQGRGRAGQGPCCPASAGTNRKSLWHGFLEQAAVCGGRQAGAHAQPRGRD